ncbi:MAG: 3-isopropylmalate dehydratase small subunit [Candidatus Omnitrophica bacterium]|nr:3-isopropylmalate dehydratase small subunit [Candidatus Omnitrophota bacterium]
MILKGRVRRLSVNDNINTDYVISGRYKFKIQDPKELAKHIFEDIAEDFSSKIKKGDFIVAGDNFGCGSSREQAPMAIKAAGVGAVIAKGFARIFYRNSFNIGLPLLECDTDSMSEGDSLEVNIEKGIIINKTQNVELHIKSIPYVMRKLLKDDGVIEHFKKHGGFKFET